MSEESFNPCFDGLPFRTTRPPRALATQRSVSILVLMDYLFGHHTHGAGGATSGVSILVLMDYLSDAALKAESIAHGMFQSLF